MAMTIDDDIMMLKCIYKDYKGYKVGDRCYRIRAALEHTMRNLRKYQMIEQIAREGKNESRCEEIVKVIDDIDGYDMDFDLSDFYDYAVTIKEMLVGKIVRNGE